MDRNGDEARPAPDQPEYLSYLLRLWRVTVAGQAIWRASLECPYSGDRLGFADLDSLWAFLQAQMHSRTGYASGTQRERR